jgi:hypothetical protein
VPGVDAGQEAVVGELTVRAERDLAQQEVADRVEAVGVHQQVDVDGVAE